MNHLIAFVCLLFSTLYLNAQNVTINANLTSGTIDNISFLEKQIVYNIDNAGILSEVLIFKSAQEAASYLENPRPRFKPNNQIKVGEMSFFIEDVSHIDYYTSYQSKLLDGKIKSINGLKIQYHTSGSYSHRTLHGKVKQIGYTQISYFYPDSYTSGKYLSGRVKKIGSKSIQYHFPDGYTDSKIRAGKFKSFAGI